MEESLEDGDHQVYVAVTDNTGKITAKSNPLFFIKTAQAIEIIPPVEASAEKRAISPTEKWSKRDLFFFIAIALGCLALALTSIGFIMHKKNNNLKS